MIPLPVRTSEHRNNLIAPLLETGSNWVESFCMRKYGRYHSEDELEELISIGYEALIISADRWIPRSLLGEEEIEAIDLIDLGTATSQEIRDYASKEGFFIYAQNRVRTNIREHLLNKDLPIYTPVQQQDKENFEHPKLTDVYALDNMYENRNEFSHRFKNPYIKINGIDIWDACENSKTPEEELLWKEELKAVALCMQKHLSSAERYVIGKINGFIGEKNVTFREVGEELGMSKQAVNEKYHRALKKLRQHLEEEDN